MVKTHINKNGERKACKAEVKPCPLEDSVDHVEMPLAMAERYNELNLEKDFNGTFGNGVNNTTAKELEKIERFVEIQKIDNILNRIKEIQNELEEANESKTNHENIKEAEKEIEVMYEKVNSISKRLLDSNSVIPSEANEQFDELVKDYSDLALRQKTAEARIELGVFFTQEETNMINQYIVEKGSTLKENRASTMRKIKESLAKDYSNDYEIKNKQEKLSELIALRAEKALDLKIVSASKAGKVNEALRLGQTAAAQIYQAGYTQEEQKIVNEINSYNNSIVSSFTEISRLEAQKYEK